MLLKKLLKVTTRFTYVLPHSSTEVRVNDYNLLLLLLWKANMDIQFVSENTLALANYVTGYVTKAEKSHLQDIFECTDETQPVFNRLFSFGVRLMRNCECGMYEAADLLLGEFLYAKSDTVKWITVEEPHKCNRVLKNYKDIKLLHDNDPNSPDIFAPNIIDDTCPKKPREFGHVCLYKFIQWYNHYGIDHSTGYTKCVKRLKPILVNHRLFDTSKED